VKKFSEALHIEDNYLFNQLKVKRQVKNK